MNLADHAFAQGEYATVTRFIRANLVRREDVRPSWVGAVRLRPFWEELVPTRGPRH